MATGAAAGQAVPQAGIIGQDNREIVTSVDPQWTAIGHVNVQGYRISEQCTGTRIAPRLVLTAAHCVLDMQRKSPFQAKNVHFIAGVDRDRNAGHAVAQCVIFPPDLNKDAASKMNADLGVRTVSFDFLRRDLALIVLNKDVAKAGVIPLAQQPLAEGQLVQHAGYHRDRRQKLMVDQGCKILQVEQSGAILTDCDAVAGSSGGAILVEAAGKLSIAAVMVAARRDATVAVPLTVWPEMAKEPACP